MTEGQRNYQQFESPMLMVEIDSATKTEETEVTRS
jgi:hypothetical protein